jgi:GntR family transcriptional regulator/MocR family aminotransferase
MQLVLKLPNNSKLPPFRQVAAALKEAIVCGRVRTGQKLPSSRELADSIGLARLTVSRAYHDLASQGYIQIVPGSGTYVSYSQVAAAPSETAEAAHQPLSLTPWGDRIAQSGQETAPTRDVFEALNFGASDLELLPRTHWQKILYKCCRLTDLSVLSYISDPFGYGPLREALAGWLRRARSIKSSADQIAVFSSTEAGTDLLSRLLINPGDVVALENPGSPGVRSSFLIRQARIVPLSLDDQGVIVEELYKCAEPIKLVYLTPSHQDPTGAVLSLQRREELLAWAAKTNAIIIEDDFDSEYGYGEKALPALKGLDRHDVVAYRNNFWKSLFPMVKLGFMALPQRLVNPVWKAKSFTERDVPLLEQRALAEFIADGHFERHLSRTRPIYARRRAALVSALTRHFKQLLYISPAKAGLHLTVRFSPGWQEEHIRNCAVQVGFPLISSREHYISAPRENEFLLGFANLQEDEISDAVDSFAQALGPAQK